MKAIIEGEVLGVSCSEDGVFWTTEVLLRGDGGRESSSVVRVWGKEPPTGKEGDVIRATVDIRVSDKGSLSLRGISSVKVKQEAAKP